MSVESPTTDYKELRDKAVRQMDGVVQRIRHLRDHIRHADRTYRMKKDCGVSVTNDKRHLNKLRDELTDLRIKLGKLEDRIAWLNKQLKDPVSIHDYFVTACRRDLDKATFDYLWQQAEEMRKAVIG
jgi:predicted  nucleic acid-binding Zn-ribbon protein